MSIRDDLAAARAEYENYIPIKDAVEQVASHDGVTVREAAQWLLNKRADSDIAAFVRYRASYLVEEVQRSDDKAGRRPYKAVREYLTKIVMPEQRGIFALAEAINMWQRAASAVTEEVVWSRDDLKYFLADQSIALTSPDASTPKREHEAYAVTIDVVAKTFVIGSSVDASVKWWKSAARAATDRPWLLAARISKGRGGANPMPAKFDLSKIFTGMPDSVMPERGRWAAIQNNAPDLYAQHEAFDPRMDG
ncbi:hypothetical protein [Paraburkholderia sp.]|uniref:hypothetical protein n=1 Tax=Paraburkholderia sp. TaxID=1926495 RepID=UPI0039E2FBF4